MILKTPQFTLALAISGAFLTSSHAFAQQAPQRPAGPVEVNGIAAKVNARIITNNELNFMLGPIYAQLATQFPRRGPVFEAKFKETREKTLQELIDRQIILDEFKQLGAQMNQNAVDNEVKRQVRELYNGDEAKFREELKRSRLTMDGYRDMTREKMIVQAMRAQQFADAPPPLPGEVNREYEKVKLSLRDISQDKITFRKIFIPAADVQNPLATPDSQLTLAEDLVKRIESGADFGELAKEFSRDAFAADGGVQKNVPRTDLSPEFAAIVFDAGEKKVVGPLLDPQGFTIAEALEIQPGPSPPLSDEIRRMLEERVTREKTSKQYERWIESKRKKAMIKINRP